MEPHQFAESEYPGYVAFKDLYTRTVWSYAMTVMSYLGAISQPVQGHGGEDTA